MNLSDFHHPFFKPLWRRIIIIIASGSWTIFEFTNGAYVWGMIFAVAVSVAAYQFFIAWPKQDSTSKQD